MHSFHKLRFAWDESTGLEIEWSGGREGPTCDVPNVRNLVHASAELEPDVIGRHGVPAMCWRDTSTLFEPLQLRENTEYLIDVTLPISFKEAETAWRSDEAWPLVTVRNAYRSEPPKRWLRGNGHLTITGRLNFDSYVGVAELAVPGQSPIPFEVACTKIGYFEDFRDLLQAIAEEYAALLLEIESPTFSRFSLSDASEPQLLTFLFLLRHVMEDSRLPAAVELILSSPRSALFTRTQVTPIGRSREPLGTDVLQQLRLDDVRPGGPLASLFRGFTPGSVNESLRYETFDTAENRYIKAVLEDIQEKAEGLRDELLRQKKFVTAQQVDRWCLQLSDWLRHSAWSEVRNMTHFPSNSQVLQKAAGYRDVLAADTQLTLGMTLPWDSGLAEEVNVHGDLRPISRLYEYWCFFLLRSILRDLCGDEIRSQGNLVRESQGGLSVALRKGRESRIAFRFQGHGGRSANVQLFYNKKFVRNVNASEWSGSYSAVFNPDFSILITVEANAGGGTHWLHFDAKYRLDFGAWQSEKVEPIEGDTGGASTDEEAERREFYQKSDLFKMHTYRDALLGSRGSYILFPGTRDEEDIFIRYPGVEYPNATGPNIPSVGAFQATPAGSVGQSYRLKEFISRCVEQLVTGLEYREEEGLFPPA